MKIRFTMLLFLVLGFPLHAQVLTVQTDPYDFQVLVRIDDGESQTLESTLDPGATGNLDLGKGYRLAITTPMAAPKGTESVLLVLSTRMNNEWLPLHTYRQPMRDRHFLKLGYRICGQQVTLLSPVGDSVPGC